MKDTESPLAQQFVFSHQSLTCDISVGGSSKNSSVLEIAVVMLYCLTCCLIGRLGAGTTRLCAGIISVAKPISIECQMANYSNSLYQQLEEETGVKTGQPL